MKKLIALVCLLALLVQLPVATWAAEEPPVPPASEEPVDSGEPEPGDTEPGEEPEDPGEPEDPEIPETPEEPADPDENEPAEQPGDEEELLPAGEPLDLNSLETFSPEEVLGAASEEGTIYDQLGMTDLEDPEGLAEREELKPYGEQDYSITVNEVFAVGAPAPGNQASDKTFVTNAKPTVYGENAPANHTLQNPGSYNVAESKLYTIGPVGGGTTVEDYYSEKTDRGAMAAGDFFGDGTDEWVATLASRGPNTKVPDIADSIQLMVQSTIGAYHGSVYNLGVLSKKPTGATAEQWLDPEFAADDLNIATGDLNGDGVDEIIVLVPVYTGGRLRAQLQVYQLTGDKPGYKITTTTGTYGWHKIYTENLDIDFGNSPVYTVQTSRTMRNHALAVGDLDGDGLDDIAVTSTEMKVHTTQGSIEEMNKSQSRLQLNVIYPKKSGTSLSFTSQKDYTYTGTASYDSASGNQTMHNSYDSGTNPLFDGASSQGTRTPLMYLPTKGDLRYLTEGQTGVGKEAACMLLPVNLGVEIVDADGALGNELLLGYTLLANTDISSIGYLGYGADVVKFDKVQNELRRRGDTAAATSGTRGFTPQLMVSAMDIKDRVSEAGETLKYNGKTVANYKDVYTGNFYVFFGRWTTTATKLTAAKMNGPADVPYIIVGNNRHKPNGSSYQLEVPKASGGPSMFGYFPFTSLHDGQYDVHFYSLEPGAVSATINGEQTMAYGYLIHYYRAKWSGDDDAVYTEFITGNSTAQPSVGNTSASRRLLAKKSNTLGISGGVLLDTDKDSVRLTYQSHDLAYSAPTVVAALASQPFYNDIARREGGDYSSLDAGTSYSFSVGSGSGVSDSSAYSLGAYVSAEVEVGCPFVSGVMEFEANYGHTWTDEVTKISTITQSTKFNSKGQDSVVLIAYPIDVYRYTMTYPTNVTGSAFAHCDYTVNVPYEPSYNMLSLDEYNRVYRSYPDVLPDIDKEVFTHEVGYPSTYPYSEAGFKDAYLSSGEGANWTTSGNSPGSGIEHTLTIEESEEKVSTVSNSVDIKAGMGLSTSGLLPGVNAKVTAGVTFGHEDSSGKITNKTSALEYSGSVDGTPTYAATGDYIFQWRMMQYMYYGKQNFPVVTYLVRNDRNNVHLPVDYGVDESQTTANQLTLYWEPSRDDHSPGLNSAMEYGIFYDSANGQPAQWKNGEMSYSPSERRYYFTITSGFESKLINYRLACKPRARTDKWSVDSETIYAALNPDGTSPKFTSQPGDLTLRPDGKTLTMSAAFEGATMHSRRWERYNESTYRWEELSDSNGVFGGVNGDTLSFNIPSVALEGQYRAAVRIAVDGSYKDFYSEIAQVSYNPFTSLVEIADNAQLKSAKVFMGESAEQRQEVEAAVEAAQAHMLAEAETTAAAEAATGTDLAPATPEEFDLGAMSVTTGNTIAFTATAKLDPKDPGISAAPTGELQFYLTHPTGSLDIRKETVNASGSATTPSFTLPRNGLYQLEVIYTGDAVYKRAVSQVITFVRVTSGSSTAVLEPDFTMPTTPAYGDTVTLNTRLVSGTNQAGTSVTPSVLVQQVKNGKLEAVTGGWMSGKTLQFKAIGNYRITLSHPNTTEKLVYNVAVGRRQVGYRIKDVVRYKDLQVPHPDDLEIALVTGSVVAGDSLNYYSESLAVYELGATDGSGDNTTAKQVALNEKTPLGTYAIRINHKNPPAANPNYEVSVEDGSYVYKENNNATQISYRVRGAGGKLRAVLPQGLASGDVIERKSDITMQAIPDAGYVVGGWLITRGVNEADAKETGAGQEVLVLENIEDESVNILVWFIPQEESVTTKLTVYPTSVLIAMGGTQQLYFKQEGSQAGVRWQLFSSDPVTRPIVYGGSYVDSNGLLHISSIQAPGVYYLNCYANDRNNFYTQIPIQVGGTPAASVSGVLIKSPAQTVVPGGKYYFQADVAVTGNASTEHTWALEGQTGATTLDPATGLLEVGEDEPSGTMLTLTAASVQTPAKSDSVKVLVSSEGADDTSETGLVNIRRSHVTVTAGETVRVPLFHAKGVPLNAPAIYAPFSDRTQPLTANIPTAALDDSQNELSLTAGDAPAGSSFVVRVTALNRPGVWDECRVDIVSGLPEDPNPAKLETRGIGAATVTAWAHSTASVVVPLYRATNTGDELVSWSLLDSRVKVMLPENSKLRDVFEPELVPVDENQLALVPLAADAMEKSRTTSFSNQTLELFIDDSEAPAGLITGKFKLVINKKLPTIKAAPITLDTWLGKATAEPVFTGGTVTALAGNLPAKANDWLSYNGDTLSFTVQKEMKGSTTAKLKATVNGWTKPVDVSIKVTATNTAPGLKLKSSTAKLYKDSRLSAGTTLTLLPKNKKDSLNALGVASVQVHADFAERYTTTGFDPATGSFTLRALKDPVNNEKISLVVRFSGARSRGMVELKNVKISVVKSALKLKPAKTSVSLNNPMMEAYDLPLALNVADVDISNFHLTLAPTGNDNAKIPEPVVSGNNRSIHMATGTEAVVNKTNKYVLSLWQDAQAATSGAKPIHKLTLSVKVGGSAAKVSLAAKGKLDISKAEPAPIALTAKFGGLLGSYDEGDDNVQFAIYRKVGKAYELVYDDTGELPLDAKYAVPGFAITRTGPMTWQLMPNTEANAALEPGSYRIGILKGRVLEDSHSVATAENTKNPADPSRYYTSFTVTASKPKAAVSGAATLYRGYTTSEHTVQVSLPAGSRAIEDITLAGVDKANMYFDIKDLGGGTVVIHFHQTHTAIKKGVELKAIDLAKTKTLTLNIFLEGGSTVKPATTAKVKVNVL